MSTSTRILDIILSLIGLVLLMPLFLVVCLALLSESSSPFFIQERLGKNLIPFNLVKFRTMFRFTPNKPTHLLGEDSVTRIGKFLRVYKIDELPQLWNVFLGQMSMVGPRPCLPSQHEIKDERNKLRVFDVRPGMTGLSQIRGIDMSTPKLLAKTDALMISKMSTGDYFNYILLTVIGSGQGDRIQ